VSRVAASPEGAAATAPDARGRLVSPALVGRAAELDLLAAAVSGPPAVVLLEGEAGIGKTRLVTELARLPRPPGRRIVVGRCRAIREPFPLGPVVEVIQRLADTLADARLSPVAGALRPLLPELADVLPASPEPLDDRVAERHRVFRAMRDVLRVPGPTVVVLEDLHWADEHTVEFLRYVFDDPPESLSWVLTLRGEGAGPQTRALAARLPPPVHPVRLALGPLDAGQTGELAAMLVAGDRVPDDFARYLCELTGGLPFAIEEVMALLRERGLVGPAGVVRWPGAAELPVPAAVRDHVLERVGGLPARSRPVLEALAVLQRPAPEQRVAAVAGRRPEAVAVELSRAVESGLLVDEGNAVGFRHVLACQAVYEGIPGPRRRLLHARAAVVLRGEGAHLLGQVVHHLRQAGRLDEWAVAAEEAADHAAALGHDDEAVRLLISVLDQEAEGGVRLAGSDAGRLGLKVGRLASQQLRSGDLARVLTRVLDRDLPRSQQAELQILLGALYDRADLRGARSLPLFRSAVENAAERPDLRAWAMVALEMRTPSASTFPQRRAALRQILDLLPAVADAEWEVFLRSRVTMISADIGDPGWRELATGIQRRTGGAPARPRHVNAYESIGGTAGYVGHYREAGVLLTAALHGAIACESERLEVFCRAGLALLDYLCGRWDRLDASVESLAERLADYPRHRWRIDQVTGGLALARGDLDRARDRLASIIAGIEEFDGSDVMPAVLGPLVRLHLSRDDLDTALGLTDWFVDQQPADMIWPAMYRCLPWLVRALTAGGRNGDAAALVARHTERMRGRDAPLAPAALHHARGYLAAAAGDPAGAACHLLAAAAHYASLPARYDAALAAEDAARELATAGRGQDAAAPLRAALITYADLDASRDLARAALAARQLDVRVPARHRGGHHGHGEQLSPRERQVAALAATGLTNKQIAAELFVSVETVKKHLQAAMRKLAVGSRTALAHRLADERAGDRTAAPSPSG
jgi:DNA-binding NarL/FixJ family response regulator